MASWVSSRGTARRPAPAYARRGPTRRPSSISRAANIAAACPTESVAGARATSTSPTTRTTTADSVASPSSDSAVDVIQTVARPGRTVATAIGAPIPTKSRIRPRYIRQTAAAT